MHITCYLGPRDEKKRRAEGKARRAAPNGGFGAYGVLTGAFIGTCLQRRSFEEILLIGSTGVQGFVLTSAFQFEDSKTVKIILNGSIGTFTGQVTQKVCKSA